MRDNAELNEKIRRALVEADSEGEFGLYNERILYKLCWSDWSRRMGIIVPGLSGGVYALRGQARDVLLNWLRATAAKLDRETLLYAQEQIGPAAWHMLEIKIPEPKFVPKVAVYNDKGITMKGKAVIVISPPYNASDSVGVDIVTGPDYKPEWEWDERLSYFKDPLQVHDAIHAWANMTKTPLE